MKLRNQSISRLRMSRSSLDLKNGAGTAKLGILALTFYCLIGCFSMLDPIKLIHFSRLMDFLIAFSKVG